MASATASDSKITVAREINVLRQKSKEGYIFPRYVWKTLNPKYTCENDTRDLFSVIENEGTVNASSRIDVEFSIFRSEIISYGLHKFRPLQNNTLDKNAERPTMHKNPSEEFKVLFTDLYYEDCKAFGYELPF